MSELSALAGSKGYERSDNEMPIKERDIVIQGRDGEDVTIDLPITRLANVESGAEVKEEPAEGDMIPIIDSGDSEQMKKFPAQWLLRAARAGSGNVELAKIEIGAESKYIYSSGKELGWADIESLTNNRNTAISAEEMEMYKDEDGGYTLKRIVYDGYITKSQAGSVSPVSIKAYATEVTSKVTVYDRKWKPAVDTLGPGGSAVSQMMTHSIMPSYGTVRDGMDDMGKAWNNADYHDQAQQRVYIDVESEGGKVGRYVLVLHNAEEKNNNLGLYQYPLGEINNYNGTYCRHTGTYPDTVYPVGTAMETFQFALWAYPSGDDISQCGPNAQVEVWSDAAEDGMTALMKKTVEDYGTTDPNGHRYPLKFKAMVPIEGSLEGVRIKALTEDPLSWISISNTPYFSNWESGKASDVVAVPDTVIPGEKLRLYIAVKSQSQFMGKQNMERRPVEMDIEFYIPEKTKKLLEALGVTISTGETGGTDTGSEGETPNETQ